MKTHPCPDLLAFALAVAVAACTGCSRGEAPVAARDDAVIEADAPRVQAGYRHRADTVAPATRVAIDAAPLAGQAEAGIQALLGAPDACEDIARGRRCRYARGATEVVFIDGMADWIDVAALDGAPFAASALARVSLPTDVAPLESTDRMMRWQNLGGFREVRLHAGPAGTALRIELRATTL